MKRIPLERRTCNNYLLVLSILALVSACGMEVEPDKGFDGEPEEVGTVPAGTDDSAVSPAPVASLHLENGNVVGFYDFNGTAFVSELGRAGVPPALNLAAGQERGSVIEIWNELAPAKQAPKALVELQTRIDNANETATDSGTEAYSEARADEEPMIPKGGCGNGCCDTSWLPSICPSGAWDEMPRQFNKTWSYMRFGDIVAYAATLCAAEGTSRITIEVGGKRGSWSVPEAHYQSYSWIANSSLWCWGPCGETLTTRVNTVENPHWHSVCHGYFNDVDFPG